MTTNRTLLDCAIHTDAGLSHHVAFWNAVARHLPPNALANDGELGSIWVSAVKPGQPSPSPGVVSNEIVIRRAPYFAQRDSATWQGDRMCFSSTCAMAAETLKPGCLAGPGQPDDRYLALLERLGGDTTEVSAQVRTLRSLGIEATFRQDLGEVHIESELAAGRPVPVPWIHHGPVDAPYGDGHWGLIVGATKTHWIAHDPADEGDMVNGGYASRRIGAGKFIRYSRRNFNRRWMVERWNGGYRFAPGKGWGLLLRLM